MKLALAFGLSLCASIAACSHSAPKTATAPPLRPGEILSAQEAGSALTIGKSTKAAVRAALGEAIVVDFESGYEVWVYRERLEKPQARASELVLLFAPSGILTKMRASAAAAQ